MNTNSLQLKSISMLFFHSTTKGSLLHIHLIIEWFVHLSDVDLLIEEGEEIPHHHQYTPR